MQRKHLSNHKPQTAHQPWLLTMVFALTLLSGCSSLPLLNGIGSAIGPALAGAAMARIGPAALPVSFAVLLGALAIIAAGRRLLRRRDNTHPAHFHPMLRTTPSSLELLPETNDAPDVTPAR